jgi:hypothetical protein
MPRKLPSLPGLRLPKPSIKATVRITAKFASNDSSECEADATAFQAEVEKVISKLKPKSKATFGYELTTKN